jgi:hypothetical protein
MIAELANSGVVRGPVWPLPEILEVECNFEHAARGQYLFSLRLGYDDRREYDRNDLSDVRDVYLYTAGDGIQTLIFADKWSTELGAYGSQPLSSLLYAVCCSYKSRDEITMYWAMLSLGKFSYRLD